MGRTRSLLGLEIRTMRFLQLDMTQEALNKVVVVDDCEGRKSTVLPSSKILLKVQ